MYPRNIRVESPEEALIAEQALAMYREMRQAATSAQNRRSPKHHITIASTSAINADVPDAGRRSSGGMD